MGGIEIKALHDAISAERKTGTIYRRLAASTHDDRIKRLFEQFSKLNYAKEKKMVDILSRIEKPAENSYTSQSQDEKDSGDQNGAVKEVGSPSIDTGKEVEEGAVLTKMKMEKLSPKESIIPGVPDRIIIERLFDGICFVDLNRVIRFWNFGATRITGYDRMEIVGRSWPEIGLTEISGDEVATSQKICPTDEVLETGLPVEIRAHFVTKRGNQIPLDILSTPIIEAGRLLGVVQLFRDASTYDEIERLNRKLNEIAFTDSLTGIPSRRFVLQQLTFEIHQVRRYKTGLWIGILDVDNFKNINDTYGHLTGDRVLIEIADRGKNKLRDSDIFGRIGGDEFLVAFLKASVSGESILKKRISEGFSDLGPPFVPDGVTVSAGITSFRGEEDETLEDCMNRADQALYEAKQKGGNQIVFRA